MGDALLLIVTWLCAAAGFGLLALGQKQNWALLGRRRQSPPAWLPWPGLLLLGAAAWPAIVRDGPAFGLLLWILILTISAITVVAALARMARRK